MAGVSHAIACAHCGGTLFREEKIVELDGTVVIHKGMLVPAQTKSIRYQYICVGCGATMDESFSHGHLEAR